MMNRSKCLACGGKITSDNVSAVNPYFHKVCMNDGVRVPLKPGKYTTEELRHTWAEPLTFGAAQ